ILNPDGVANDVAWYREVRGTPFETTRPPRLGQPWAGTDNNRDWFMNNQPETRAASRILYKEWYPQIVYNQHQPAPEYARIFIPPFADPVNPDIHPGVTTGVNMVGAAMAARFAQLGMPGYVSRSVYSMWWNGGMRLTPYFHNQVGLLTETAHRSPTPRTYDPENFPLILSVRRGLAPRTDSTSISYPDPWFGEESHIRDAFDYMQEATIATLDLAARYRERFLYNIYKMGRDAIELGERGGPFAYVIPEDQWDPSEAVNLVNLFRHSGVEVHRATRSFSAGGQDYPAGSYILYTAQAFRPHVVNLMEPQWYPERERYPGGPPEVPYDLAGWTVPMQMGVRADRIEDAFNARTEAVVDLAAVTPGEVRGRGSYGYVLSSNSNAAFHAVNKLLSQGQQVLVSNTAFAVNARNFSSGSFVVRQGEETSQAVTSLAQEHGLDFFGIDEALPFPLEELSLPRVGLYKAWHSRVDDQGWTLWLMEQYDFPIDTLHDADIQNGDLSVYDAIILPNQPGQEILLGNRPGIMPDQYVGGVGAAGSMNLKRYVEMGGTLIAFDEATDFPIDQFGLPVRNSVAELPPQDFFIPGSLIRTDIATDHPFAGGMQPQVAASFSQSRAFQTVRLPRRGEGGREDIAEADDPGVEVIATYAEDDLLMSGWAMGEERYLAGKPALVNVELGSGNVVLFGFRPQFRGQPRGTYKLLFNAIQRATVKRERPTS
ncbi:MAG: peptidase M14, partial [Gemmatimonadota bacterium]|nr:peptidase M14 [Gemmatimonadota bacterium]